MVLSWFVSRAPKIPGFLEKLTGISTSLSIKPDWLLAVMWNESRLNPKAVNSKTRATGLIQFMPATANGLNTTVEKIALMDANQQLDYVRRYFQPYSGKMKSVYDVYKVVFFPAMIGKAQDWVLQAKNLSASQVAKANPLFDLNKDSKITVREFETYIREKMLPAEIVKQIV